LPLLIIELNTKTSPICELVQLLIEKNSKLNSSVLYCPQKPQVFELKAFLGYSEYQQIMSCISVCSLNGFRTLLVHIILIPLWHFLSSLELELVIFGN